MGGFRGCGAGGRGIELVFLPRGEGWEGLVRSSIARSSGVSLPAKEPLGRL